MDNHDYEAEAMRLGLAALSEGKSCREDDELRPDKVARV